MQEKQCNRNHEFGLIPDNLQIDIEFFAMLKRRAWAFQEEMWGMSLVLRIVILNPSAGGVLKKYLEFLQYFLLHLSKECQPLSSIQQ